MKLLYYIVLEYLLILKLHVLAPFKKVPQKWQEGDKGDLILVQGFCESWYFFSFLADKHNRLGYKVHVIPALNYNVLTISESAAILKQYIQEQKLQNVHLLSHSKGGIVAKRYMDTTPNNNVLRSISITTPYKGSIFGYVAILSLKELIGTSNLIKELLADTKNLDKIINIYVATDNHIIPNSNAVLPGAKNIQLPIFGHTRVLFDEETFTCIKNYYT